MNKYLILFLVSFPIVSFAQSDDSIKTFRNVSPNGYSQFVEVDLGNAKMVVISGQVAIDKNGATIGPNDLEQQLEAVFNNIKTIAMETGGSMNDVVKLTYYLTDISKIQIVRNVRDKFINHKTPPASTAVEVSRLFRDDVVVELEATLIIQK